MKDVLSDRSVGSAPVTSLLTAETLGMTAAMVDDLCYLRRALLAAEIPFLLIRTERDRPAIAVDAAFRPAVRNVLVEAIADGFASADIDQHIVAFGGRADTEYGVELEFWDLRGEPARCPRPNALTRVSFDLGDIEAVTIRLLGCEWPTLIGMFDTHVGDVGFDIDIVFSWVDGSDPEFRARRATLLAKAVVGEGDEADARIRQIDELKYALRSVHRYAPWIRRIFIATDSAVPQWLLDDPKVTVVRAVEHFSDPACLPTYNSHAVESQLHHIDGLSEHFLYSNDDMFFARPVRPSMFFTAGGVSKFIEATTRIGPGENNERRSGFENAARVNRQLLHGRFGQVITRHLEHTPAPLRRSVLRELEAEFADDFARTQASRFRSSTDISVTNSLYHYYALLTGKAVQQESALMRYVDTTTRAGLELLDGLAARRDVDFFCLNDGSFPEVVEAHRMAAVSQFLSDYFPDPAPWERVSEQARRRSESSAHLGRMNALGSSHELSRYPLDAPSTAELESGAA